MSEDYDDRAANDLSQYRYEARMTLDDRLKHKMIRLIEVIIDELTSSE